MNNILTIFSSAKSCLSSGICFVVLMWLTSRSLILLVMLIVAPLFPPPPSGQVAAFAWSTLANWDGVAYTKIAVEGYLTEPSSAFFPLFPLLIRLGTLIHLSPAQAGVLVSAGSFLGALILIYVWTEEMYGPNVARWATALMAWCPFSLFGTVVYTEGLFLLLTIAALKLFERHQYWFASLCGGLASATRLPGIVLSPTFLIVAFRERRSLQAYGVAFASSLGLVSYSLYNWQAFEEPLRFIHAQEYWNREELFWGQNWVRMFAQIIIGPANTLNGGLVDPLHPLLIISLGIVAYAIWKHRLSLGKSRTEISFIVLSVFFWLLGGDPLINSLMVLGGLSLVWLNRKTLTPLLLTYSILSFLLIFATGRTMSVERFSYGIMTLPIALTLSLRHFPRYSYATVIFFGVLLITYSLRFAYGLWVA